MPCVVDNCTLSWRIPCPDHRLEIRNWKIPVADRERELFSDMPRTKKIERIEMAEWVSMDEASTDPYGSCRMVCVR